MMNPMAELVRMSRFALVSVSGTLVHYAVLIALVETDTLGPLPSSALGFLAARIAHDCSGGEHEPLFGSELCADMELFAEFDAWGRFAVRGGVIDCDAAESGGGGACRGRRGGLGGGGCGFASCRALACRGGAGA